jgi:hypothetical protein
MIVWVKTILIILYAGSLMAQEPTPTPTPKPRKHPPADVPRVEFNMGTEPNLDLNIFSTPTPPPLEKKSD